MATVPIPYIEAGLAAFDALDDYTQKFLFTGSDPKAATFPMTVNANQALSQWHVVGLNGSGKLVPALWDADPEDAIQAIGVVTQAVTGNVGGTTTVPVFFSGCFNPDALVWPASFDSDAKKLAAFRGADTPTTIQLRKRG